ncbi:MAG: hypothetical protein V1779_12010 [bacterium]
MNTTSGKELRLGFIRCERDYENNYFSFGARNYDSETGCFPFCSHPSCLPIPITRVNCGNAIFH